MSRVLIATGGTGGHILPSEALAEELQNEGVEILLSGANLSRNRYVSKGKFPTTDIRSGMGWKGIFKVLFGIKDSLKVIDDFKPDAIIGFGSYTSFPLLVAGKIKGIPLILWAADTIPGKVIRWFSPYSKITAIQFPESAAYLSGIVTQARMPLRKGFQLASLTREAALEFYQLEGKNSIILIMGGSQGAKFLNVIAPIAIGELPNTVEVIHIAGSEEEKVKVELLYKQNGILARVKAFEPQMQMAWRAADIALTRAGAVSCAEQIEFEVPGILVPYPFSSDQHQEKNGRYLVSLGLAEMGREGDMTPEDLSQKLYSLLRTKKSRQEKIRDHKIKRPNKPLKTIVMEIIQ